MRNVTIPNFEAGLITSIEDKSIPRGASSRSLGWLALGDIIELTRGRSLVGTEITSIGRISGLGVGFKSDGTQILFKTYGKKLFYYDEVSLDWIEIGSDILTSAVVTTTDPYGEDVTFAPYTSLSGAQMWLCSPNSPLLKIMTANPGTAKDNYDSSKNFKGYIKIKNNSMFLWNRGGITKDNTGLYRSYLDRDEVADYTPVTNEALGISGSLTYTGTLSTVSGKKICFGIVITDTSETFTDDKNGNLIGSAGGTGTINYSTGAYSVTFHVVAVGSVTANYYTEDSTSNGIADFTKSGTRTAGQGFVIRQDDAGGALMNVNAYNLGFYCFHKIKTWLLTLSSDDLTATNNIYREKVGIPNFRASAETGSGIYYIDDTDENEPRARLLTIARGNTEVIPIAISDNLDLADYRFDKAAGIEWGDYILFACRTSKSVVNNIVLAYDKVWKAWSILPFYVSCFAIYNGVLVVGDSLSNNVYELFSGLSDDDSLISNYWEGNRDLLNLPGMKKPKGKVLEGNIGPDQGIRVYVNKDNSGFVEIGVGSVTNEWPDGVPAIYGKGSYIDRTQRVTVGSLTLGRGVVGAGSDGVEAYHYERKFLIKQDRGETYKIKFVAVGIGYASVSQQTWYDVRHKSNKVPLKYTSN